MGPGYPQPMPPQPSSANSFLWALAPLFTCGFATPFTIGYGASRLKSKVLAASALVYGLGLAVFWFGVSLQPEHNLPAWADALMVLGLFGNWGGGTVHSFLIRSKVFDLPNASLPKTPNERAVAQAQHRRMLREQARQLAEQDPSLARELCIGRPDLPRQYDDGGLVDVNHAPTGVIAALPGMTPALAEKVVEVRETVGVYVSAEDVSATVSLPPHITAEFSEYTIYLP